MTELHQGFPSTRWSSVLAARDGHERALHLDHLCRAYWTPVYCYIRRAWGKPEHESLDLTQDFFTRILESDFLKDVDPSKGRFRSYVRACLRHFLLDAAKHDHARKRGGGAAPFSLDSSTLPLEPEARDSDEAFDLEWVAALLRAALPLVEKELTASGRAAAWTILRRLDIDSTPGPRPTYADLSRELSMAEQAVKSSADYARKLLRRFVLDMIRDYTAGEEEAASELRELFNPQETAKR